MKSMYEPIEWLEKARLDFYEETKDMTTEEWVNYIHSSALSVLKEYGLTRSYEQLLKSKAESAAGSMTR